MWSHSYNPNLKPCHYVQQCYNPTTGYHIHCYTVYCDSHKVFCDLIKAWNDFPIREGISYLYHAVGQ